MQELELCTTARLLPAQHLEVTSDHLKILTPASLRCCCKRTRRCHRQCHVTLHACVGSWNLCSALLQERELCATARLLPAHYLELKALMLRDAQRRGCLPRAEAKGFFRLDAARAVK